MVLCTAYMCVYICAIYICVLCTAYTGAYISYMPRMILGPLTFVSACFCIISGTLPLFLNRWATRSPTELPPMTHHNIHTQATLADSAVYVRYMRKRVLELELEQTRNAAKELLGQYRPAAVKQEGAQGVMHTGAWSVELLGTYLGRT